MTPYQNKHRHASISHTIILRRIGAFRTKLPVSQVQHIDVSRRNETILRGVPLGVAADPWLVLLSLTHLPFQGVPTQHICQRGNNCDPRKVKLTKHIVGWNLKKEIQRTHARWTSVGLV